MELIHNLLEIKEIDMISINSNSSSEKTKNKIFSKVSRIFARSKSDSLEMILDVNTEIYPVCINDVIEISLVKTFYSDSIDGLLAGNNLFQYFDEKIIDLYEYVMYGTIFHMGIEGVNFFVYSSFGGLLMKIYGSSENYSTKEFEMDGKILLLIRKT